MPPSELGMCGYEDNRRPHIDPSLLELDDDDASTVGHVDSDEEMSQGSSSNSIWNRRLSLDSLDLGGSSSGNVWHRMLSLDSLGKNAPKRLSPSGCDDRRGSADPPASINSASRPSKPGACEKHRPNHRCPSLNQSLKSIIRAPRYPPSIAPQAASRSKNYRSLLSQLKDLEVKSLKSIFGSDRGMNTKNTVPSTVGQSIKTKGTVATSSRWLDSHTLPSTATDSRRSVPGVEDGQSSKGIFGSDCSLGTRSTVDSSFRSWDSCSLPSAATRGNRTPKAVQISPNNEVYVFCP